MKKRLRRKKRVGEFAEFGVYVEILLEKPFNVEGDGWDEFDRFWNEFHDHFTAAGYCLALGGNPAAGRLGCIAEMEHHGKPRPKRQMTQQDRLKILGMLAAHPHVKEFVVSRLVDLFHWTKVEERYFNEFHAHADVSLGPLNPKETG